MNLHLHGGWSLHCKSATEYCQRQKRSIGSKPISLDCGSRNLLAEAQAIDAENGDTLWWDAIVKEMKNVRPAFEKWEGTRRIYQSDTRRLAYTLYLILKWARISGRNHDLWLTATKLEHLHH
jgi:hypothetical protein